MPSKKGGSLEIAPIAATAALLSARQLYKKMKGLRGGEGEPLAKAEFMLDGVKYAMMVEVAPAAAPAEAEPLEEAEPMPVAEDMDGGAKKAKKSKKAKKGGDGASADCMLQVGDKKFKVTVMEAVEAPVAAPVADAAAAPVDEQPIIKLPDWLSPAKQGGADCSIDVAFEKAMSKAMGEKPKKSKAAAVEEAEVAAEEVAADALEAMGGAGKKKAKKSKKAKKGGAADDCTLQEAFIGAIDEAHARHREKREKEREERRKEREVAPEGAVPAAEPVAEEAAMVEGGAKKKSKKAKKGGALFDPVYAPVEGEEAPLAGGAAKKLKKKVRAAPAPANAQFSQQLNSLVAKLRKML